MLRHLSTGFYRALANPQSAAAMCRGLKQTTGLVGIEVDPNARENLIAHLNQVKNLVSDLIPVDTEYRKLVEQTCDYKLKTIESVPDDKELEEVLGFQLEEEIILCQDEIGLIPKMAGRDTCVVRIVVCSVLLCRD